MKTIRLANTSIFLIICGFFVLALGIISVVFCDITRSLPLISSAIAGVIAFLLFLLYDHTQKHAVKLILTPQQVTVFYNKGKKETIRLKDIESLTIKIYKPPVKSANYQIAVSFQEKSGYQNYFCIAKANYNTVFKIYDAFAPIIPTIHINAAGSHAAIIQADIDAYLKHQKRIPWFVRFWLSCNKREKIEVFLFTTFFFLPILAFILFLFIKYQL